GGSDLPGIPATSFSFHSRTAPSMPGEVACIAATQGMRQASGRFRPTDARVRKALRLLPLPLCIAMSLTAQAAEDRPEDWRLCPIQDAVPAFADAQQPAGSAETRTEQPTDIEGDQLAGTEARPEFEGNVALRRGDQFLGTNKLTFDSDAGHYLADGSVRYQDSGMRLVADSAEGNQNTDTHNIQDVRYQLVSRRGNGGAEHIEMH